MSFTAVPVLMVTLMALKSVGWIPQVWQMSISTSMEVMWWRLIESSSACGGKTAETAPEIFWQQGLVGFGGLGLMIESPENQS